jgi:adenine-specific DNA-methyltransferase
MIYIDPPYNTGNDSFIYPDKFAQNLSDYQKQVGDKAQDGHLLYDSVFRKNKKENGQYHSNWLSMMMPRLYLAKNLLRSDGVIFISIDDNEVHNLRLLCNEVFGEENFINQYIVKRRVKSLNSQFNNIRSVNVAQEYILIYAKGSEFNYYAPFKEANDKRKLGYWNSFWNNADRPSMRYELAGHKIHKGQWKWESARAYRALENYNRYLQIEGKYSLLEYWQLNKEQYLLNNGVSLEFLMPTKTTVKYWVTPSDTTIIDTNFMDYYINDDSGMRNYKFDTAKSEILVNKLVSLVTKKNDIILDFFAGSGTTAHAVMELNKQDGGKRQYICVQLPEICDESSEAAKAGYKTIADICKERIRRVSKQIQGELDNNLDKIDLGFKVFKLAPSNFKHWQQSNSIDKDILAKELELFVDSLAKHATTTNMLYEFLLKTGKSLTSKIQECEGYIAIEDNQLILILEIINQDIIKRVISSKPKKVIALDILFKGDDQLKTNTNLQMQDANIEFKTV